MNLGRRRQQLADALDDFLRQALNGALRTHPSMGPVERPGVGGARHVVAERSEGRIE